MPEGGSNDNDQEEEVDEEEEECDEEDGNFHSVHSDSEGSESDEVSEQDNSFTAAGLRKNLLKEINKAKGKGGDGLNKIVDRFLQQERHLALLERQRKRPKLR